MGESANRAQRYHDLAFECLVWSTFSTNDYVRENYRMMGQYYLAKAHAELTRAKQEAETPTTAKSPPV
jgi:hypothetical protein